MRTFLNGLLLGIILGAGGFWLAQQYQLGTVPKTRQQAVDTVQEAKKLLDAKLEALELQSDKIQEELTVTGRVVRQKARVLGGQVADAAADAGITAAIKAKLVKNPDLSALAISVSTTDGTVTLSGKVGSPELVGKATLLALETEGVREVVAALQVPKE